MPRSSYSANVGVATSEKKKQRRQEQARKDSTPATKDHTSNASCGKARKDLSHITCFNCGETGHYADKCPEPGRTETPQKTSNSLGNFRVDNLGIARWNWILFLVFDSRVDAGKVKNWFFGFEKMMGEIPRS